MTETALTVKPTISAARAGSGRARDRMPDRLNSVIEFLQGEAAANDDRLEEAIAMVVTGIRDGSIRLDVGKDLMTVLSETFRDNDHIHDVATLLREANMEVAQREVERVQNKRRKQKAVKP